MKTVRRILMGFVVFGFVLGCQSEAGKAKVFEKKGDWAGAQQLLEKAIAKKSDDPRLYNEVGYVYLKRGYYEMAMNAFTKAIVLDPYYVEAFFNRGALNFHMGNALAAQKDYEKTISLDKNYAKAYNNLGLVLFLYLNNQDEALVNYKKAIELEPDNATFHYNLYQLYQKMGKEDLAKEEQERAKMLAQRQKR